MTESFDAAYYADLESRVMRLIDSVQESFRSDQVAQLREFADHNEPAVAVEMLSEMLRERNGPIAQWVFSELRDLAETMRLESVVLDRLTSLVRDE